RVTTNDNNGGKVSDDFQIAFSNLPPVVAVPIPDQSGIAGQAFTFTFPASTFSDPNGDVLSYTAHLTGGQPLPVWLSFDAATRTFAGSPSELDFGNFAIQVNAHDGEFTVNDVFEYVLIDPSVNLPPVTATPIANKFVVVGQVFEFAVPQNTFSDPNGDTLVYSATLSNGNALPQWLNFDAPTRTFSGTPQENDIGTIEVKLSASDADASAVALFS